MKTPGIEKLKNDVSEWHFIASPSTLIQVVEKAYRLGQQDARSDDAGLVDEMAKVLNLLPTKDQCCVCLVGEFCAPCLVNRTLAKYAALQSARKDGGE